MTKEGDNGQGQPRVLLAKTSLDGHWRGVTAVAKALQDAGIEVVMLGMARPEEIVSAAVDEDVDVVGLNVGGHVAIVKRILEQLRAGSVDIPVMAGGTLPPAACRSLEADGVAVFPPGSALADIVDAARRLTREKRGIDGD